MLQTNVRFNINDTDSTSQPFDTNVTVLANDKQCNAITLEICSRLVTSTVSYTDVKYVRSSIATRVI